MQNNILEWYMKGFNDELDQNLKIESTIEIENIAYNLGVLHAIVGDDVSSIDNLSDDEIIELVKDLWTNNSK